MGIFVHILSGRNYMKAFLEEYGVIVVAAIIITIIVVFATPLGKSIRTGIVDTVNELTTKMKTGLAVSDDGSGLKLK